MYSFPFYPTCLNSTHGVIYYPDTLWDTVILIDTIINSPNEDTNINIP